MSSYDELLQQMRQKYKNSSTGGRDAASSTAKESGYDGMLRQMRQKYGTSKIDDTFISKFIDDSQNFLKDTQSRFDGLTWSTGRTNTWADDSADYRNRSSRIRAYLRTTSNPYDEKTTADLNAYLDSLDRSMDDLGDRFHKASQHFSQWDTEELYNRNAPENREKRQQTYTDNQKKIEQLQWELSNREYDWTDNSQRQMMRDIEDQIATLQTENRLYERGEGGYVSKDEDDMYTLSKNADFAEVSAKRDFGNPTLEEYDRWYTAQYGGQQIDSATGKVVDVAAPVTYEDPGTEPQIKDRLGFYFTIRDGSYTPTANYVGNDYYQVQADAEAGAWDELTEDEISSYYYLMNTKGNEAAMKYLDSMTNELTRRRTLKANADYAKMYEEAGLLGKIGMNAATIPAQTLGGAVALIDDAINIAQGKEINPYSNAHGNLHYSQTVRGTTAEKIDEAVPWAKIPVVDFSAGDLYQTGMSGLDSLAVSRFGKLGGVLLGAGAASSEAMRLYQEGASREQIVTQSVLAGAAEMIFENIGIDNLLKIKDVDTVKDLIVNVLKQGSTEALEEGGTEIANILTDTIVRRSESDWAKLVAANGGDTWKAFLSEVQTVAQSTLGGFFSGTGTGGISAGASYAGNQIQQNSAYRDTGRQLIEDGGVDPLTALAKEMYGVTEGKAQRQLGRQTAKVEKSATPLRVGKLQGTVQENMPAYQKARAEQTRAALVKNMTEKGVDTTQAENVADAIATAQAGEELSQEQMETLRSLPDADDRVLVAIEEVGDQLMQSAQQDNVNTEDDLYAPLQSAEGKVLYKDKPVEISGVDSAGDGKLVVTLEDGHTADVAELSFPDIGEKELYEAVAKYADSADSARQLLENYRTGNVSAQIYARGIAEAHQYGRLQYTAPQLLQEGVLVQDLNADQITYAYDLGKSSMRRDTARRQQEASQKGTPRTGSVNYGYKGEKVDKSRLNEAQKVVVDFAERLADKKGMTFYFYRSHVNAAGQRVYKNAAGQEVTAGNGYYDPRDSSIHIDLNAGDHGSAMLSTLAHELVHFIQDWSPEKYRIFCRILMEGYTVHGNSVREMVLAKQAKYRQELGVELTYEQAYDEVIASSLESVLNDGNVMDLLDTIETKDKSLWEQIRSFLEEVAALIHRTIQAFRNVHPESPEGRIVERMTEIHAQLQQAFAEGLHEAGENYRTGGQKNTANEGGVKYAAKYDYTKSFADQLKDFQNGTFPERDALMLGATPAVLQRIGLVALPMTINQQHVRDALYGTYKGTAQEKLDHTFTPQELATLPQKIADPVAIIHDKRTGKAHASESVIDIIVEMTAASGKQVLAAIQVGSNSTLDGNRVDANKVSTVHGNSDAIDRLVSAIQAEESKEIAVFYIDKKRTTKALQRAGNPIPGQLSDLDGYIHSISDSGSPVKIRISAQTDTRQFIKWFKGSKIVNADGTPKVVYHGSYRNFTIFDGNQIKHSQAPKEMHFFTDDIDVGYSYTGYKQIAKPGEQEYQGGVYPVYLNVRNPLIVDFTGRNWSEKVNGRDINEWAQFAKDNRYDGLVVNNVIDEGGQGDRNWDENIPRKPATTYVVFKQTQIKSATDNIGTFDGSNPDIRYSARYQQNEAAAQHLQQENSRMAGEIASLTPLVQALRKMNGGKMRTAYLAEAVAHLKKIAGAGGNSAELGALLSEFYSYVTHNDDYTWEDIREKARPVAAWLMEHTPHTKQQSRYAQDILKHIHNSRISLDDTQKAEAAYRYGSYDAYRRRLMGTVFLSDRNAVPLDAKWQELSQLYPDVFNPDTNAADMPEAFLNAIHQLRNSDTTELEYEYNRDFIEQDLILRIYDSFWNASTLNVAADYFGQKIRSMKEKHNRNMSLAYQRHQDALAKQRQNYQERLEAVRAHQEERYQRREAEYRESRQKAVERHDRAQMRQRIRKEVESLRRLNERAPKDQRTKEELQTFAQTALRAADAVFLENYSEYEMIRNGIGADLTPEEEQLLQECRALLEQLGEVTPVQDKWDLEDTLRFDKENETIKQELFKKVKPLRDAGVFRREFNRLNKVDAAQLIDELTASYAQLKTTESDYLSGAYQEEVYNQLQNVKESIGAKSVKDMTMQELQQLYEMYHMVLHVIRTANETFAGERGKTVTALGNSVVRELEGRKKQLISRKIVEDLKKTGWNGLTVAYAFRTIGSDTMLKLYKNLRDGEDVWARDMQEAKDFWQKQADRFKANDWDMDKRQKFYDSRGNEFSVSLGQLMSLYALSKRRQAWDHLEVGGFMLDNSENVIDEAKNVVGKVVNKIFPKLSTTAQTYRLTRKELDAVCNKLTPQQRAFVDATQNYLSADLADKGNEVSMKLYGIKLFKDKDYFPLRTASQGRYQSAELIDQNKLKNSGFTKELKPKASNSVVLSSYSSVWTGHVNQMGLYHGLTLPMEDMDRVLNFGKTIQKDENGNDTEVFEQDSVCTTMQNIFGQHPENYIRELMKQLNGGVRSDDTEQLSTRMLGRFKKAAVAASLSVWIQQWTSMFRAMAYIDPRFFAQGPQLGKQRQAQVEDMKAHCPVAIIKEMGGFDTGMGASVHDFITGRQPHNIKEWGQELLKHPVKQMDEISGWLPQRADENTWVRIWIAAKRETLDKHKDLRPGSDEFYKLASDRFNEVITLTQVYDSVMAKSAMMRSKNFGAKMITQFMAEPTIASNMAWDAGVQMVRTGKPQLKTAGALVASVIVNAMCSSLIYAMRDDDEEETFLEKYAQSLISNLADGLNPLTYIPIVRDIWSIAQGYDVGRSDMELWSSLSSSLQKLTKKYADEDATPKEIRDAWWSLADNVFSLFGIPEKNVRREINAGVNVFQTIRDDFSGRATTGGSLGDTAQDAFLSSVPILGWIKGENKAEKLLDASIAGDTKYVARLRGTYKTENAANNAVAGVIRDRFEEGKLTKAQAIKQLTTYAGKNRDEAEDKLIFWQFKKDHPDSKLDDSVAVKWVENAKPAGISLEIYTEYRERASKCESDKDKNGKTIPKSLRDKVWDVIDSQPLSKEQKDILSIDADYKDLDEAPWH